MAAPTVTLIFDGDRKETVTLNTRALIEAERKFGGQIPGMEGTLYAAWFRLGKPGKFDDWLDTVEIDTDEIEDDPAVPTHPEASGDS